MQKFIHLGAQPNRARLGELSWTRVDQRKDETGALVTLCRNPRQRLSGAFTILVVVQANDAA
jgi:hypothetical protein